MEYLNFENRIRNVLAKCVGDNLIIALKSDDNILEKLGINSLQMVKFIANLEKEFKCDLSLILIYETWISIDLLINYIVDKRGQ